MNRRALLRLASDAVGAALFCAFLRIGIVESITVASVPAARTAEFVHQLNLCGALLLPLAVVLGLCLVAWDARRVMRLRRRGVAGLLAGVI